MSAVPQSPQQLAETISECYLTAAAVAALGALVERLTAAEAQLAEARLRLRQIEDLASRERGRVTSVLYGLDSVSTSAIISIARAAATAEEQRQ